MRHYKGWILTVALSTGAMLTLQVAAADAQERRNIYADPTNLQVLPKDISVADLRNTMRNISLGTGIRCNSCHVGEEGQSMLEYDFAADVKERKKTAREMLRMVATINKQVATIRAGVDHQVAQVQCVTCHRGIPRPLQLGEELDLALEEGGVEAAKAK